MYLKITVTYKSGRTQSYLLQDELPVLTKDEMISLLAKGIKDNDLCIVKAGSKSLIINLREVEDVLVEDLS